MERMSPFRKRPQWTDRRKDVLCMSPAIGEPWHSCLRYTVIDGMCLDHAGRAGYFKPARLT